MCKPISMLLQKRYNFYIIFRHLLSSNFHIFFYFTVNMTGWYFYVTFIETSDIREKMLILKISVIEMVIRDFKWHTAFYSDTAVQKSLKFVFKNVRKNYCIIICVVMFVNSFIIDVNKCFLKSLVFVDFKLNTGLGTWIIGHAWITQLHLNFFKRKLLL